MSEGGEKFRVSDRRRFDPDTGEPRPDAAEDISLPGGGVLKHDERPADADIPVGFDDLVRPFLLMGLAGLGVIPHPDGDKTRVSLVTARTAIETLELLRERTEGHRSDQESRLLEQSLYELKVNFVEVRDRHEKT
ncbi:MAG: DUF1844 domain-containing protein [Acidobacteriota bacterium]|nr:DUF1844 domain-containing protein [Acidobacteriota bacterium]